MMNYQSFLSQFTSNFNILYIHITISPYIHMVSKNVSKQNINLTNKIGSFTCNQRNTRIRMLTHACTLQTLFQISFSKFSCDLHSRNVCACKTFTSHDNSKIIEFMYHLDTEQNPSIFAHYHNINTTLSQIVCFIKKINKYCIKNVAYIIQLLSYLNYLFVGKSH